MEINRDGVCHCMWMHAIIFVCKWWAMAEDLNIISVHGLSCFYLLVYEHIMLNFTIFVTCIV